MKSIFISSVFSRFAVVHSFIFHVFRFITFFGRIHALSSRSLGFGLQTPYQPSGWSLQVTSDTFDSLSFSISAFEVKTNWPLFDVLREANFKASVCLGVAVVRLRYPCSARCEHARLPCAPLVDVDH